MFAIRSYIAENGDALDLVEGEKVYVIGRRTIKRSPETIFFSRNFCSKEQINKKPDRFAFRFREQ